MLLGAILTIPLGIFQIIAFTFPGLRRAEKRGLIGITVASTVLLIVGSAYGYSSILPISIEFLTSADFSPTGVGRILRYSDYIEFFLQFLLAFGISFQMPVIVIFLVKAHVLTVKQLLSMSKLVVIVIFIVAAIITPPDVISQLAVAIPMLLLYFLSVLLAAILRPRTQPCLG
jgi:sec-independent protein translocase protein TatC